MTYAYFWALGFLLTSTAYADLSIDQRVSKHARRVVAIGLESVQVVQSSVIPPGAGARSARLQSQIEFRVRVEGNLCGTDPQSLAVDDSFSAETMMTTLQFYTLGESSKAPPCFAYSRPVPIRYVMELDYTFSDPAQKYSSTVRIPGIAQVITLEASLSGGMQVRY